MPLLEVADLHAHYDYAPVLQAVSFTVGAGEIVSVFGRNGAGKTTALRTIMGWLRPARGTISFDGRPIGGLSPDRIFRRGIAFIPEDRRIFPTLSVEENLVATAASREAPVRTAAASSTASFSFFLGWGNGAASSARRCPAASSRCSRSVAP